MTKQIRKEVQNLSSRGNITWKEYETLPELSEDEKELLYPVMTA